MQDKKQLYSSSGFTLVELIIAMLLTGIISIGIFSAYKAQQASYIAQDQVTEMQQNIRAGIDLMIREVRIAGYNPTLTATCATINTATQGRLNFTKDDLPYDPVIPINGDGDCTDSNENITFGFSLANDTDSNGIADGGGSDWDVAASLGRDTGGGFQPIADNIEAIEFYYTLDDGTQTLTPAVPGNVRSVQISILARANNPDQNFTNAATYTTASGTVWNPIDNNYRRRLLITTVQIRNLGLGVL